MKDAKWLRHAYAHRILELWATGALDVRPGEVRHVDVLHDDWCPALRGGVCACKPEIRVRPRQAAG